MKKSLLLAVVLSLTAFSFVKAQDPVTWTAKTYCTENSIAADAVALTLGQEITVGDLTFTSQDKPDGGWLNKVAAAAPLDFTYNGVTYPTDYVQGQGNPKNGVPMPADAWSAVAIFNSTSDGSLDIAFKFGYNKKFWVAAIPEAEMDDVLLSDSTAVSAYAYEFAEGQTYWGGYFDPSGTPPGYYYATTANADPGGTYFTGITLDVKADYNYYVFFSGSKLMLCGLTYTATPVVTEYSVSGKVTVSGGTPVEGVVITSSDTKTATTNASGEYSITGITAASITLTPSKADYTFAPLSINLTMDKNYTGQDFVATPAEEGVYTWMAKTYCTENSIAADAVALTIGQEITVGDVTFTAQDKPDGGWLSKPAGAAPYEFTYNGNTYYTDYVQGQGNPKNGVPMPADAWSAVAIFNSTSNGTLDIAFKFGYNKKFWVAAIPVAELEDVLLSDSTAVSAYAYQFAEGQTYWGGYFDPAGTPPGYYYATTANADPGGSYYTGITLEVKPDVNYYVFFSGSKLMLCGLTYTAAPATEYSVSGKVALADGTAVEGVLITSSDTKTATTNASGEYTITGITAASITLTPSKTNYTFAPATINLTMDKNYTGQDFVATSTVGVIDDASNLKVVSSEYYNIIGQKLSTPRLGELNIIVKTMSDGTVRTEKVLLRK